MAGRLRFPDGSLSKGGGGLGKAMIFILRGLTLPLLRIDGGESEDSVSLDDRTRGWELYSRGLRRILQMEGTKSG